MRFRRERAGDHLQRSLTNQPRIASQRCFVLSYLTMQIVVQIPDELVSQFSNQESLPREFLEAYAAEVYRSERWSRRQVGQLLGLDRWKTEEFLANHHAQRPFTPGDYDLEYSGTDAIRKY
jgi:hypothetical protein